MTRLYDEFNKAWIVGNNDLCIFYHAETPEKCQKWIDNNREILDAIPEGYGIMTMKEWQMLNACNFSKVFENI